MENKAWQAAKKEIDAGNLSVCAWCRRPYTDTGVVGTLLTDDQYSEILSHGICPPCKLEVFAESRARKAGAAE